MKVVCPYCHKEFNGVNKEQLASQLAVHKIMVHKDKVKITEVKNAKKIN